MFNPLQNYEYGVNKARITYTNNYGIPVATIGVNNPLLYPVSVGMSMSPDGTKVFCVLHNGNNEGFTRDSIMQFNLSTPWDLRTMSTKIGNTPSLNSFPGYSEQGPIDAFFSPDGLNLYVTGTSFNRVYRYTLGTAYTLSTATAHSSFPTGKTDSRGLSFSQDGTKMFVVGSPSTAFGYNLSVAWDITTATLDGTSKVITGGNSLHFKADGMAFYTESGAIIHKYYLAIAWDLSSWIATEMSPSLSPLTYLSGTFSGLVVSADGSKLFISNYSGSPVKGFNLTRPFQIYGKLG